MISWERRSLGFNDVAEVDGYGYLFLRCWHCFLMFLVWVMGRMGKLRWGTQEMQREGEATRKN
jgi:hypothetical protein